MNRIIATFSIAAVDPATGEAGVAVQSKFLGVGSVVPWAKAGVGAVATQAFANPAYGPEGLYYLSQGKSAQETLNELIANDESAADRQVGVVDNQGCAATYTGDRCYEWAGGITGRNYAAQGNILVNRETVTEMGKAFEESEGTLADRLLSGLQAAQRAGGDKRGKQSAAIYIEKEKGGYGGLSNVFVDLRVDDHPDPIDELTRIYHLHQLYFAQSKPEQIKPLEGALKNEVSQELKRIGYLSSSDNNENEFYNALKTFLHTENFEEREQEKGLIDLEVVKYLKNMKN
ncbi:DUF1028 domain-containing protein [Halobacillus sp. Marseille-P3879]|uniref:DUF1028 domain-containing protein n=1 Tax=Halobacillus sp. Marseille-P3879 TaxID=2045014 RepID=UPI001F310F59|nr:DUF1028 domain-containing protein [Halobacillus sp. Marseille-P3879]